MHTSLKAPCDAHKKTHVSNIWELKSMLSSCVHVCVYIFHETNLTQ